MSKDFFLEKDGSLTPAPDGWKPGLLQRMRDWMWYHPIRCWFGHRWIVSDDGRTRACSRCGMTNTVLGEEGTYRS